MPWSTSELAELAGTTVNTVRHYHRSGVLEEPERMSNGYKQYGARHLVRLLQIRRLRDLGVPLAQIESVGPGGDTPNEALLAIDADLAASIERLQRARAEIRAIVDGTTTTDLPAGFEDVARRLSTPERSLMLVYEQLYDPEAMADLRTMVETESDDGNAEFEALTADADDEARQRIAEMLAPAISQHITAYPWLSDPTEHLSKGPRVTAQTFLETVTELFNEAQLDVLGRASALARELATASSTATTADEAHHQQEN
ncbi:transcriptional regulator, MerR family protein [Pseudoclavibacter endophyticus]|uniref:MerR family transcriptional regulator n=1 Tax=Pseudoclavibacter endophyticus TaxID=1778590 RepID=A0A6H9WU53_9MICO|nr:MerR family transcriptional regulator [Pseudoclavibacter endophyticus]KAB1650397.1 MerR family transcriptional regulator [Pseudoclavibacter endophyticus]GGA54485.1 transcriptional regulator, MerR family protein [Pseudoclavibacter endophyticus]